jgi:hypothetical protein
MLYISDLVLCSLSFACIISGLHTGIGPRGSTYRDEALCSVLAWTDTFVEHCYILAFRSRWIPSTASSQRARLGFYANPFYRCRKLECCDKSFSDTENLIPGPIIVPPGVKCTDFYCSYTAMYSIRTCSNPEDRSCCSSAMI